jgi:GR25 family glycosyltransferase involved in LPS biosynthesis
MMTAFVINLDKDKEKYKLFLQNFKTENIIVERVSAIDGKEYRKTKPQDLSFYASNFSTNKAIGCFKSHLMCWQKIVNRNLPYAIIFEDDIIADKPQEWEDQIITTVQNMSNVSWDIILLGYHSRYVTNYADKNPFLFYFLRCLGYGKKSEIIKDNIITPVTFGGTHAYVISNTGAKKLLNELKLIGKTSIDLKIASLHAQNKINLFACVHPIINTYGASEDQYTTWILSEGLFMVGNCEIKHYHLLFFLIVCFLLLMFTRNKHFLNGIFFIIFLFLFLQCAM